MCHVLIWQTDHNTVTFKDVLKESDVLMQQGTGPQLLYGSTRGRQPHTSRWSEHNEEV